MLLDTTLLTSAPDARNPVLCCSVAASLRTPPEKNRVRFS